MREMLSLQDLFRNEELRLEQLQQRLDKTALKAIEKEWRKMNVRSNVETVRGQHRKGATNNDKYQTITHADSDARKFYDKHSKSKGRLMLVIQAKTKCLEDRIAQKSKCLEDKANIQGAILKIQDIAKITYISGTADHDVVGSVEHAVWTLGCGSEVAGQCFVKPDTAFEQSADMRGGNKKCGKKPTTADALGNKSNTAVGASLKLPQKHQKTLMALGFNDCHTLGELPPFANLRHSYKKELLALHPDKRCNDVMAAGGEGGTMSFEEFQDRYQELLAMFYDVNKQDFNASVKMHLPSNAHAKGIKVGNSG